MNKSFLVMPLVLFVSIGTVLSQPSWVKSRTTQKYPDLLYVIGIGFANKTQDRASDLQKAYDAAFADIAKQIKSTVASQTSSKEYEVLSENKNSLEQQTSAEIKVSTEVKLGGLKIVDAYDDDDNKLEYALAVLDRAAASDQLKSTLNGYLSSYRNEMASSKAAMNTGDLFQSMLSLTDVLKNEVQYNNILPIYNFISGPLVATDSAYLMPGALLLSDTKAIAKSMFTGLRLEKVVGDTQSVSLRGGFKPLLVKVEYLNGKSTMPAAGMKLSFSFRNGSGKLTPSATTDKSGSAECDVFSLTPYSGNIYTIAVSLDLSEFKISGGQSAPSEFQDWNSFIDNNRNEVTFTWKKWSVSLQDKLADAILLLNARLPDSSGSISVSRILYQDKVPGPMAEFLRQQIESTIQSSTPLLVISEDAVRASQMELSNSGYSQNLSQPDYASGAAGAKYIVTGNYWEEDTNLDLSLKVIDVNSHVIVGTSSTYLPLSSLPKVDLAPSNYNPTTDENLIKTEKKGEDLKVDVWVDRPSGVYHEGDTMSIYFRTNRDCYVRLVYNDAGGNALLVFPNKVEWNSRVQGGAVIKVPGMFVVGTPFGREILKAYASDTQMPVPRGQEVSNLIVLPSLDDFQSSTRSVGLTGANYSENSVVITTMPKNDTWK